MRRIIVKSHLARIAIAALALAVAACGGRQAQPVAKQRDIDARLTCAHLTNEKSFNDARMTDLLGEIETADQRSFAFILVSPLFIDLSDSERTEIEALVARNEELDRLIAERGCA